MDFSYYTVYWLPGRLVPGKIYNKKGVKGLEGVEGLEGVKGVEGVKGLEGVKRIEGIKGSRFNRILQRETGFCEERSDEAILSF